MNTWTADELRRIGDARELYVETRRSDGTLRNPIQIWHVRVDDEIYIRSAHGPENGWFRHAKRAGAGRIQSGGVQRDVAFEPASADLADEITVTYHAKYDRYGPAPVGAVTGDDVLEATLRVVPQD
ncbi:DUF2255 family protein [Rhodococcus sp. NPDC127530]|uniref:DUF2255 family protein n=1 Tax=unclassified Rhodococcus (in: high G+C Gram-positive bacteria) TaxID=192944 RepID=UPI00363233F0